MKKIIQEIEAALEQFPKRTSKQNPESYIGGGQSKLKFIGLKVPQLQSVRQKGFSFSDKSAAEQAKIWDYVWHNSDCYEVMSLALSWFYDPKQAALLEAEWPRLKNWAGRIDNWGHSDTLSGIYARIFEANTKGVLPTLEKWNHSSNPWLRRLSIVSLFYYSSQRKKYPPFPKVIELIEAQLEFDHYYVQKGVGWTLRESGNVYPEKTYRYLEKNIRRISSHAYSAATEKLPKKEREYLKGLRKSLR